jgi:hypothetical protein
MEIERLFLSNNPLKICHKLHKIYLKVIFRYYVFLILV